MKRLLSSIRRSLQTKPAAANRSRTFRPQLEQLDERLLPSLSSAISIEHLGWTERDWYTVDQTTLHVIEFKGTDRYDLGRPVGVNGLGEQFAVNCIVTVSASVDPKTGQGEVFVMGTPAGGGNGGEIWLCDSTGTWHYFGWDSYDGISATRDGHVYGIGPSSIGNCTEHVRYQDSNGYGIDLGAPGGWTNEIAASVGRFGDNEVFAVGPDHAIYVNSSNTYGDWQLVDNKRQLASLSATPNNTVFALTNDSLLYQETQQYNFVNKTYYWAAQYLGAYFTSISADTDALGRDEVYAIDVYANAWLCKPHNEVQWTWKDHDVYDIAGAGAGYFYEVNYASGYYYAFQWNPNGFNPYGGSGAWTYLGSGLS